MIKRHFYRNPLSGSERFVDLGPYVKFGPGDKYKVYDLYMLRSDDGNHCICARYGDDESKYLSGGIYEPLSETLEVAKQRAIRFLSLKWVKAEVSVDELLSEDERRQIEAFLKEQSHD